MIIKKLTSVTALLLAVAVICFSPSLVAAESIAKVQPTPAQSLLPMLGGLAAVLVLIFILATMLKKLSNLNLTSNHIKVIESQPLGAKEKLVIVEIQNKQIVLGVTPHSIQPVTELDTPLEKKNDGFSFDVLMKQLITGKQDDTEKINHPPKVQVASQQVKEK